MSRRRWTRRSVAGILVSAAVFSVAAVAWAYSGPATITHFTGNIVSCTSIGGTADGTFGSGASGTYNQDHNGNPSFSVDVTNHGGNPVTFDFTSSVPISDVIVKVGNGGTIYHYSPSVTSDTGLESLDSSGGPKDSISHLVFCEGEAPPSAVSMLSFAAKAAPSGVHLSWKTASEAGTLGFNVYRQTAAGKVKLNSKLIVAAGSSKGGVYSFVARASKGSARYLLQEVQTSGATRWLARTRIAS
jgi:hypothetical protein